MLFLVRGGPQHRLGGSRGDGDYEGMNIRNVLRNWKIQHPQERHTSTPAVHSHFNSRGARVGSLGWAVSAVTPRTAPNPTMRIPNGGFLFKAQNTPAHYSFDILMSSKFSIDKCPSSGCRRAEVA